MSINTQSNLIAIHPTTANYRNAIYQGCLIEQTSRTGYGIVYVANSHDFIVCTNWQNDQTNQNCLFFNTDEHYCYGEWLDNKPHGLNLLRVGQVSLIAQFFQGRIQKGKKILIHYEKYSIAAIFIVRSQIIFESNNQKSKVFNFQESINFQTLELYIKKQLMSKQELKELYVMCGWGPEDYDQFQSLIRFLYSKMNCDYQPNTSKKAKLRLINNIYYRFGYDHGLAIVFNDQYKRVSVGYHDKSMLCSYGALFSHSSLGAETQQGIFNQQQQVFVFPNHGRPQAKIGKIYSTNLLMGLNFVNKFYQNPSTLYFKKIENLLHTNLLKSMVSGHITTRRLVQSYEQNQVQKVQSKAIPQNSNNIYRNAANNNVNQPLNTTIKPANFVQQQKKRLQAIKKQIYNSIQRRKNQAIQQKTGNIHSQQNSRIINYQQVGARSKVTLNPPQQNLRTPEKTEKSRSKKKIFKELRNGEWVPSQFSPDEVKSTSLTPFKRKMKHRIFQGQEQQGQRQISHKSPKSSVSMKHPHSSYKVPIHIQQSYQQQSISQYQSPYQKFNTNTQNQQSKSKKVHRPATTLDININKSKLRINQSESPHVNSYLQKGQNQYQYQQEQKRIPKTQYIRIDQKELKQISAKKKSLKDKANQERLIEVLQNIQHETSSKANNNNNNHHKNTYEPIKVGTNKSNNKRQETFHNTNNKRKNQIYLVKPTQQKSKSKPKYQQFNQTTNNRYGPVSANSYSNQAERSNSYTSKHQKKKQIDREIQRSPDRYRCYGNDLNNLKHQERQTNQRNFQRLNHPYTANNYPHSQSNRPVDNNRHSRYSNSQFQYQKMF